MQTLKDVPEKDGLAWANRTEPSTYRAIAYTLYGRFRYHWLPEKFSYELRLSVIFFAILRLLTLIITACFPIIIKYFYDGISTKIAIISTISIIFIMIYNYFYDEVRKNNKKSRAHREFDEKFSLIHRESISKLSNFIKFNNENNEDIIELIIDILSCIEEGCKEVAGKIDARYFTCNLLLFDEDVSNIYVKARSDRGRALMRKVPAMATMAYYVALSGVASRAVEDIRREALFASRGLSEEKRPYRSVLILPVIDDSDGKKRCIGVVTVDSGSPFEFIHANAYMFENQIMPFLKLLAIVLRETANGLGEEIPDGGSD